MPKALGRMADSSDPVSKRIAVFFRGEDAPSMKTFEATQKTFRNKRKARYGMTYQGRRFPEFQESTGNAWLRSGRARGRAHIMAVKMRTNTAATRCENSRGGRPGIQMCRHC
ncbi:hypothetical protein T10_10857 [Trichinella papuae]|uniref:Uncharacterized protein n=1 Tax=Trichinella papuae TaxID=268474 RepID=A0A0V1N3E9_9BILA|nr:hypothetical protein T10_10857 [Trichinella papuae]